MSALSSKHHTLIQAFLSRGPLKEEDLHKMFEGLTAKNPRSNKNLFNEYIRKINLELSFVQFEIRAFRNQYDGTVYYGLVNNVADEQSKLGTRYSVPQICFYKCVVDAIMQDAGAQGVISSIAALNIRLTNELLGDGGEPASLHPAFKAFTVSHKERTLDELVADQWLCSTTDGFIGLGVRSFLDLRSWFRNNEVPSCDVCNEAGVKAELCENEGCMVRIHLYCLPKKFGGRSERLCPGCGTQWKNYPETTVFEEEIEQEVKIGAKPPRAGGAGKKKLICKEETSLAGMTRRSSRHR